MKRIQWMILMVLAAVLTGCAATFPLQMTANESYLTHPDQYTVLGMVEGTSTTTSVLGFPFVGDAGYRAAYQDAIAKAAGADGLINVVADLQSNNLFIVRTFKTTVRGLAVKKKA